MERERKWNTYVGLYYLYANIHEDGVPWSTTNTKSCILKQKTKHIYLWLHNVLKFKTQIICQCKHDYLFYDLKEANTCQTKPNEAKLSQVKFGVVEKEVKFLLHKKKNTKKKRWINRVREMNTWNTTHPP